LLIVVDLRCSFTFRSVAVVLLRSRLLRFAFVVVVAVVPFGPVVVRRYAYVGYVVVVDLLLRCTV
jgi:hypothetical protein